MTVRRAGLAAIIGLCVTVPARAADAARTPPAPVITTLTRVPGKGSLFNLRVTVELPRKLTGSSAYTEIVGRTGKSCRITGNRTSCTITGLKKTLYFPLRTRSRDASGVGPWSRSLDFHVGTPAWVRAGYDSSGKKLLGAVPSSTLYWKMLGTTSKWSKFQALKRSNTSSASFLRRMPRALTTCGPISPPAVAGDRCVAFNLEGIVGLALASSSSSCGSNVECALAVTKEGSTASLYSAGGDSPAVKDFYSAPNGRVYVVFKSPTQIAVGGPRCVFVEVNTETGLPTCVDSDMTTIQSTFGRTTADADANPPVQFDSAGTVYYMGNGPGTSGFASLTLRASSNGVVRNVINDNIAVTEFIVLGDGTLILNGRTISSGQGWVRKVSPSGAITSLINSSSGGLVSFVRYFADGNLYIGLSQANGEQLILRYDLQTGTLDPVPWMSRSQTARNEIEKFCRGSLVTSCPSIFASAIANFGSSRTLVVTNGQSSSTSGLFQYYPVVEPLATVLEKISIAYKAGDYLLLAGTNSAKKNMLTAFNTVTNREEIIMDGSNEVEIYSMAYVPSTKKVMFNGLNFADGKYIVSEVAIP